VSFADRLDEATRRAGHPCVVGIDPHPELLPEEFALARDPAASRLERARAVAEFACSAIDVVAGEVAAVKPQSALFELFGADGAAAWERVVQHARERGLLVIGDVKRGDIESSAAAYAEAYLGTGPSACDAITINPLLGSDSVQPFLELCRRNDRGVFVLVRTSNPDGAMFQGHGAPPLAELIAGAVHEWGRELVGACGLSSVGAVVGATRRGELARLRSLMPHAPLLLPGYGAQGGRAADVAAAFQRGGRGALVSSSRGILFAYRNPAFDGLDWRSAARAALDGMIREVRAVQAGAGGGA
jgi:orotidine-5'-phosphate decarboxylase